MEGISLLQDFAVVLLVAGLSGWVFRKLGLSAVVGYLVAGIIIGPFTPPFSLVTDVARIGTLTDLGLAFLMFFVGLGLSLKRIRRMGFGILAATAITAFCVFQFCQLFSGAMGWDPTMGLVFAAMLMTSSSAIITKMLSESGLTHERFAQNAQGVTVLEDIVAIVLLTILGSKFQLAGATERNLGDTLFLLVGFTALVVVAGLIFVPRLLSRFGRTSDSDLHSVLVSGLIFIAGVASIKAGFSVALGAFLFGVVVSETRFKTRIEKSLGGAQDMFSAIFFVAIGMLIDVTAFAENAGLILGIAVFAILARTLAASLGFLLTGHPLPLAVGSAVVVTPIGEFAYVIAQLGVDAKAVPPSFYAVAVGVSIITAVFAPLLAKNSSRLSRLIEEHEPRWLSNLLGTYRGWLASASAGAAMGNVWRLTRRRVGLVAIQLLMLGGLFGFARPIRNGIAAALERGGVATVGWDVAYWTVLLLIALVLVGAMWQSVQTLCMIYAEALSMRRDSTGRLRAVLSFAFQLAASCLLASGVWLGFPIRSATPFLTVILVVVPLILVVVLWRQLAAINIRFEESLVQSKDPTQRPRRSQAVTAGTQSKDWNLEMTEHTVPERAACAGKSLRELELRPKFGCTIVEIDRQGFVIDRVRPNDTLFPGDRILMFGQSEQIDLATAFLNTEADADTEEADFAEAVLDTLTVSNECGVLGRTLAEAGVYEETGVQIVGIERRGERILNPSGQERIEEGDRLLVMGSTLEIREFSTWMSSGTA